MHGFMVAGTTSGVGKTTVTLGIIGALRRRGMRIQPFKAGPDYIDPSYHSWAAGKPCRNLDTWLVAHEVVRELFSRAAGGMDAAIVEGVMGLFDGRSATTEEGSGAQIAKLLGLPIILVIDASKAARSVAAMVQGYQRFDPGIRMAGVILNRLGSPRHGDICKQAIETATGLPVLGILLESDSLRLPERHLGLIPETEGKTRSQTLEGIVAAVEQSIDLPRLLQATEIAAPTPQTTGIFPEAPVYRTARIAVAMDKAFNFYYRDSLDLLEAWGADVVPFSPLADTALPEGATGVYIGGGFPELHAQELSENGGMVQSLKQFARTGMPIYAECGGLMYLAQSLEDLAGKHHSMAGLIPLRSRMTGTRLTLGYRTVRPLGDGPVLARGQEVRGHEFHWSKLEKEPQPDTAAYELRDEGRLEGFHKDNVLASYLHVHFATDRRMAQRFVRQASRVNG